VFFAAKFKGDHPLHIVPCIALAAVRKGKRLPASYVNFYIANKAVVVPQFNQPKWDEEAIRKLRSLFPEREIIGVQSRDILIGGGNIHCITQQVPLCTDTGTDSSVV